MKIAGIIAIMIIAMSLTTKSGSASQMKHTETICLAMNIYHEARSKSLAGQIAVGNVTLNRVHSDQFPDTVCEVVYQKHQFSWYWDGKDDTPHEDKAWETSILVAEALLDADSAIKDNTHGALYYHADYVEPYWSAIFEPVKKIGPHIFYVDNRS